MTVGSMDTMLDLPRPKAGAASRHPAVTNTRRRRNNMSTVQTQPSSREIRRASTPGSVSATKATPASAPAKCASWLMRPRACRDAHQVNAKYSTANSGAGIGTG
jgi:hypothetical protein